MIQRTLKKILHIYFYIGVNVIGIPQAHRHTLYLYKLNAPKFQPNCQPKLKK